MNIIIAFLMITLSGINTPKSDLTITVDNIKNSDGLIIIGIYNSEATFPKDPFIRKKVEIVDHKASIIIKGIEYGEYAISVLHDENNNNKIDFHFYGSPSEKTAASNNAKGFLGPPKWLDAKFTINKKSTTININL